MFPCWFSSCKCKYWILEISIWVFDIGNDLPGPDSPWKTAGVLPRMSSFPLLGGTRASLRGFSQSSDCSQVSVLLQKVSQTPWQLLICNIFSTILDTDSLSSFTESPEVCPLTTLALWVSSKPSPSVPGTPGGQSIKEQSDIQLAPPVSSAGSSLSRSGSYHSSYVCMRQKVEQMYTNIVGFGSCSTLPSEEHIDLLYAAFR